MIEGQLNYWLWNKILSGILTVALRLRLKTRGINVPQSKENCQHWDLLIPPELTERQLNRPYYPQSSPSKQAITRRLLAKWRGKSIILSVGGNAFPISSHEVILSPPEFKWMEWGSRRCHAYTSWQIDGETVEIVTDFILGGFKITSDCDCSHELKRYLLDSLLKSRDITLPTKVCLVKAMVFPVVICGCESWTIKKTWVLKNWCFWTVVLEKTLERPLDCKEIQPVHPKGDQSWIFTWRTDAEAETPVLWPPHVKSWLIWKDPDTWKDWRREEKGTTEDEMVGWHHRLDGHEFE